LRLGDFDQALNLLEAGARQHPRHFALRANLGTAWQLAGNLTQAAEHLTTAMELATPPQKKLEQLHLRLVLHRLRSPGTLDVLFPLEYSQGEQHKLGKLRSDELEKLPADAVALVQKLALSLPGDGLLLWQLGELACVYGDYASALEFLDLCLGEYGLTLPELRRSRQALQAQQESSAWRAPSRAAELHQKQHGSARLTFLSRRPFVPKPLDFSSLRSKRSDEPHLLVWPLLAETGHTPDRFAPRFHSYLNQLDNQTVVLMGFLHPLTDDLDCTSFLLVENPIGCWYCTAPDLTGMVFVSMKENTTTRFTRDVIQVTGKLKLNRHDPEEFLFNINQASVTTPR
ncbi:MAG TPA: tetratricopeptide repeat protein, partial [Gemmatales bacterium]|nr:tetratricopeptide repeat protein [Gemmatales bacterium]